VRAWNYLADDGKGLKKIASVGCSIFNQSLNEFFTAIHLIKRNEFIGLVSLID
jgi:hypothetical protein